MICPSCHGAGTELVLIKGTQREISCLRCHGAKLVPDEMAEWIRRGREMRDRRVNGTPYRTMEEEAELLGIDCLTLSRMENGKIEPYLSPEEAQAAYDAAVPIPLSEERIEEIVRYATSKKSLEVRAGAVFAACNVCGAKLKDLEEDEMGMCLKCAAEGTP